MARRRNDQFELARKFGYVESLGGQNSKRGDLVPFNDNASPLSNDEIDELYAAGFKPGLIKPRESTGAKK
ncbi:MAG: hypothetical protein WC942_04165 [Clostridia bacterium]|jgi:hypothetical protein